ncbi:MAG: type VI secretion system tip protein TssI/VgrG [Aquisalimonadaceae bacterium]
MSENQHIQLVGSLAETFKLRSIRGNDELGRLFEYTLELLAVDESLTFGDVLGRNLTVRMNLQDGERFYDGFVTRFAQVGRRGRYALYEAQLRPWLWYLTRTEDCRIFQNKSVPEILDSIFREHGYTDFETSLTEDHEQEIREFCVQYRESDFNFVSRLMEEEGIYYFFRHQEGKHVLVLADGPSSHETIEACEEIPYLPPGSESARRRDHVRDWWLAQEIQPESYAHRDFDFLHPGKPPEANEPRPREHQADSYEVYDYPGGFGDADAGTRGKRLAGVRIDERVAEFERVRAQGNVRGLEVGGLFSLAGYPRDDQNREYLATSCSFEGRAADYEADGESEGASFQCTFTAIDSGVCFRAARLTRRPVVQGPQTATVVGPGGETVHTDEYGRVKCQFHWDREGARDDNSSCWVRVSQASASSGWGSMFLPHIDDEVIVAFLEGDPDRPIIVGRVYNADNMPPCNLPGNKYCSVIRDHFGNELLMDGTPGREGLSLYSPSHRSELVLGRSFQRTSDSDDWEKTYGNSYKVSFGNSVGISLGQSALISAGVRGSVHAGAAVTVGLGVQVGVNASSRLNVTVGPELALSMTTKVSWGYSREYNHTKSTYRRTSGADIVMDSDKQVILAGGKDDRTMLISDDDEISMAYGTAIPRAVKDAWAKVWAVTTAASGVAAATAVGVGVNSMQSALKASETEQNPDPDQADPTARRVFTASGSAAVDSGRNYGLLALGFGTAAFASIAAHIKASASQPPPAHTDQTARIGLRDGMVDIWAGKGESSSISLRKDSIDLTSKGDITLWTGDDGDVVINKVMQLSKKSKLVKIKGVRLDHKNLKVFD